MIIFVHLLPRHCFRFIAIFLLFWLFSPSTRRAVALRIINLLLFCLRFLCRRRWIDLMRSSSLCACARVCVVERSPHCASPTCLSNQHNSPLLTFSGQFSLLPRSNSSVSGVRTLRQQDTSAAGQFGSRGILPKCPDTSAALPMCLRDTDTSAMLPKCLVAEMSCCRSVR